jgi:hypothetical protein
VSRNEINSRIRQAIRDANNLGAIEIIEALEPIVSDSQKAPRLWTVHRMLRRIGRGRKKSSKVR